MAVNERSRRMLYDRLEEALGVGSGDILMEYLPPVGWAEVATRRDIDELAAATRRDLAELSQLIESRFARIDNQFALIDNQFARVDDGFARQTAEITAAFRGDLGRHDAADPADRLCDHRRAARRRRPRRGGARAALTR